MIRLILCLVTVLGVSNAAWCVRRKVPVPDPREAGSPARLDTLRASRPSYLLGGRGGQREVRYLSVCVSNIGDVVAKDVQVSIGGPSGLSFPLRGPKRLSAHANGVYVSTVRVPSGVALQPHAIVTCSTCRR